MVERVRDAAGTRSMGDLVREPVEAFRWLIGSPSRGPDDDLDDLRQGRPLRVAAFARRGRRLARFQQGCLILQQTAPRPVVWHRYRILRGFAPGLPVDPPYDIEEAGRTTYPGTFHPGDPRLRTIVVHAAGHRWELAVTRVDLPLVRAAFTGTGI